MTLSGYFCAIGQQALAFFFGSAVTQGPVLLHVEMCTFLDGFVTDMEQNIGSINRHPRSTTEERFAAYRKLCELISFDAEVKRLYSSSAMGFMFFSKERLFAYNLDSSMSYWMCTASSLPFT